MKLIISKISEVQNPHFWRKYVATNVPDTWRDWQQHSPWSNTSGPNSRSCVARSTLIKKTQAIPRLYQGYTKILRLYQLGKNLEIDDLADDLADLAGPYAVKKKTKVSFLSVVRIGILDVAGFLDMKKGAKKITGFQLISAMFPQASAILNRVIHPGISGFSRLYSAPTGSGATSSERGTLADRHWSSYGDGERCL